jgi:hypothetical protein
MSRLKKLNLLVLPLVAQGLVATAALAEATPAWLVPEAPPLGLAPASAGPALALDELAKLAGGAEQQDAPAIAALTTGSSNGNSITANNVSAGDIQVQAGAMNFSGIGNFVWNTGQNNNLQGVLNVNITITPDR